jgi:hypothetical protein
MPLSIGEKGIDAQLMMPLHGLTEMHNARKRRTHIYGIFFCRIFAQYVIHVTAFSTDGIYPSPVLKR